MPASVLGIRTTFATPSELNRRICLALTSSKGSPRRMNSRSSPLGFGGSVKTATRDAIPPCTRSAACNAPAGPESADITMISATPTGSLTDERPSCGSQKWRPNGGNSNDARCNRCDDDRPDETEACLRAAFGAGRRAVTTAVLRAGRSALLQTTAPGAAALGLWQPEKP